MPDGFTVHDVELMRSGGSWGSVQGADVTVCDGVTLHFASLDEEGNGWGFWAVTVDNKMYGESRDLVPDEMPAGQWRELLEAAVKRTGGPRTEAPAIEGKR
jgi:hypothetical protein